MSKEADIKSRESEIKKELQDRESPGKRGLAPAIATNPYGSEHEPPSTEEPKEGQDSPPELGPQDIGQQPMQRAAVPVKTEKQLRQEREDSIKQGKHLFHVTCANTTPLKTRDMKLRADNSEEAKQKFLDYNQVSKTADEIRVDQLDK